MIFKLKKKTTPLEKGTKLSVLKLNKRFTNKLGNEIKLI